MAVALRWAGDKVRAVIRARAAKKLDAAGAMVVARARQLAPVDTGKLRAHIGYTVRQSDLTLTIHADMPYSAFQEFGTRMHAPHPFLRPAITAASRSYPFLSRVVVQFSNTPGQYQKGMAGRHGGGKFGAAFGRGKFG